MKNYKLEISNQAARVLEHMARREPQIYKRVASVLDGLEKNPYQGKALKGQLKGRYSYRVGSYRIIYSVHRHILTVYVIDVGHRRDVYR